MIVGQEQRSDPAASHLRQIQRPRPLARATAARGADRRAGPDHALTVSRAASRHTASQLGRAPGRRSAARAAGRAGASRRGRPGRGCAGPPPRSRTRPRWRASPRAAPRCPRPRRAPPGRTSPPSPAADAPAQLVELREPEALGVLDDHHRRVGHVDAHLDHRRRHEHVDLARRKRAIAAFARRLSRPWRRSTRASGSAAAIRCADSLAARRSLSPSPRPAGRRRTPGAARDLSCSSAAPRAPRRGARAACAPAAARRQLVEHGQVEVAVHVIASVRGIGVAVITSVCGARVLAAPPAPRAGARRSGAARPPRRARARNGTVLEQRVRADHDIDLAGGERAADAAGRGAAGREQLDAQRTPLPTSWRSVRWCCSASISVGARNAVWCPASATATEAR